MKNFLILISFLFPNTQYAQFGDTEKENLFYLCKVWGYYKYFHPNIQECNIDWDLALMESLTEMNGTSQDEFITLIEKLIEKAGELPPGNNGLIPDLPMDEKLNNFNISWFEDEYINENILQKLEELYSYSREAEHCQLIGSPYASHMKFVNENPYDEQGDYPDLNHRIVAFFRYWTIIDYFFPYKFLTDQEWDETFDQLILETSYAQNEEEYMLAFLKLTSSINDTHSYFFSPSLRNWRGLELNPFEIKYVENQTIISRKDSSITDLEIGDIILTKNNEPFQEIRDSLKNILSASNDDAIERRINLLQIFDHDEYVMDIQKEDGSIKSITINPNFDQYLDFHLEDEIALPWKTIEGECAKYGYIDVGVATEDQASTIVDELWDHDILIFDLRKYPTVSFNKFRNHLFNEEELFHLFANPSDQFAGLFNWTNGHDGESHQDPIFEGQVFILINNNTISSGEFNCMAYENHHRAKKIGSQTAGADGNTTQLFLPGMIRTSFTSLGVYYPDQSITQRIGIVPDIEIRQSIQGIREGRDEILEAALDCSIVEIDPTSIEDELTLNFNIYPNPFGNELTIVQAEQGLLTINIFDSLGKHVFNDQSTAERTINTSNFKEGIYFLQLTQNSKTTIQTLVKL